MAPVSSIARAILSPSLPIPDADRVVRIYQTRADRTSASGGTTSAGLFRRWQDGTRDLFGAMTAYRTAAVTLSGDGPATRLDAVEATPEIFDVMNAPLALGRPFTASDASAESPVVVISHALWRQRFNGDRAIVGRTIRLNGTPWTIVGVAADGLGFPFSDGPDFWRPLVLPESLWSNSTATFLDVVGRLQPDVSHADANARLASVTAPALADSKTKWTIRERDPEVPIGAVDTAEHLIGASVGRDRFNLAVLTILACLATLLAIVGIAGVMAYVVGQRTREIGIRLALGAPARGVERLLVRQGLMPVLFGLAGGLLASYWLTSVLQSVLFEVTPRDPATLAIAAALFLVVGIVACWWPTRAASRIDPVATLRSE